MLSLTDANLRRYLDANLRILFKGHVAEVQILVESFAELKSDQTPLYNLARTIGLVGPLQPEYTLTTAAGSFASTNGPRLPRPTRNLLLFLRSLPFRQRSERGFIHTENRLKITFRQVCLPLRCIHISWRRVLF